VRLIDRAPHATETSKALVVWSRTLELMDRMGCTRAFLDAGLRAPGASIRSGGKVLGSPRLEGVASAYNFALMIPQCETERLLAAHLGAFGVEIGRQVELVDFAETADGIDARVRHADGREDAVADRLRRCSQHGPAQTRHPVLRLGAGGRLAAR
jgi:2-polyprenyl-6-methoxyphenol hydroxylase-like FAD-dependent oxidoreductase